MAGLAAKIGELKIDEAVAGRKPAAVPTLEVVSLTCDRGSDEQAIVAAASLGIREDGIPEHEARRCAQVGAVAAGRLIPGERHASQARRRCGEVYAAAGPRAVALHGDVHHLQE